MASQEWFEAGAIGFSTDAEEADANRRADAIHAAYPELDAQSVRVAAYWSASVTDALKRVAADQVYGCHTTDQRKLARKYGVDGRLPVKALREATVSAIYTRACSAVWSGLENVS